jgi:hypothetical protein
MGVGRVVSEHGGAADVAFSFSGRFPGLGSGCSRLTGRARHVGGRRWWWWGSRELGLAPFGELHQRDESGGSGDRRLPCLTLVCRPIMACSWTRRRTDYPGQRVPSSQAAHREEWREGGAIFLGRGRAAPQRLLHCARPTSSRALLQRRMRAAGGVWSDGQRQSAIRGSADGQTRWKPKPSDGRDRSGIKRGMMVWLLALALDMVCGGARRLPKTPNGAAGNMKGEARG